MSNVEFEIEIEDNAHSGDAGVLRGTFNPEIVTPAEAEELPDYLLRCVREFIFGTKEGQEYINQEYSIRFRNIEEALTTEEWAAKGIIWAETPKYWFEVEAGDYALAEGDLLNAIESGEAKDLLEEE